MPSTPPEDAPTLTAWIDTDGDDDQLHVAVEENGTTYETIETHIGMLAANKQYLDAFENPALTLLTLYNRAVTDANTDAEPDASEAADD